MTYTQTNDTYVHEYAHALNEIHSASARRGGCKLTIQEKTYFFSWYEFTRKWHTHKQMTYIYMNTHTRLMRSTQQVSARRGGCKFAVQEKTHIFSWYEFTQTQHVHTRHKCNSATAEGASLPLKKKIASFPGIDSHILPRGMHAHSLFFILTTHTSL